MISIFIPRPDIDKMKEKKIFLSNDSSKNTRDLTKYESTPYVEMLENKIISGGEVISANESDDDSDYSYVLLIEGKNDHRIIYLEDALYEVGRRSNANIRIRDRAVSRYHATIVKEFNPKELIFCYKIIDGDLSGHRSRNGLVINHQYYKTKYLEHGDLISFSNDVQARFFVINKNSLNEHLFFDFENKEKYSKTTKSQEFVESNNVDQESLTNLIDAQKTLINIIDAQKTLSESPEKKTGFRINSAIRNSNDLFIQKDYIIEYISKLSSIAELSPYPIIEINLDGDLTYYNPSASILFPDLNEQGINHPLLAHLLKADHKIQGNLFVREVSYKDKIFEQYIHYLPDLKLIRSYIFDFTKRKKIESKLKDSEEKYRAVIEQISEGILLFNADDLEIIEANASASKILNYPTEEIIGKKIEFFINERYLDFQCRLNILKQTQYNFREEIKFKVKDSEPIHVELSVNIINYDNHLVFCCVFRDITARKKLENQLKYQAYYDTLTDLYQRNYFKEFFEQTLRKSKREQYLLAVMFLDVDNFKQINDNYGHDIGDLLLKQFAQRLKNSVRNADCIGRWGGDEFVILLVNIVSVDQVDTVANRITKAMQRPFQCHEKNIETSTSIGVALFPKDGDSVDSLMKKADKALYITKAKGRNGYTIYDEMLVK